MEAFQWLVVALLLADQPLAKPTLALEHFSPGILHGYRKPRLKALTELALSVAWQIITRAPAPLSGSESRKP